MPPTLHAILGASGSKRWMTCPGSVALSEGLPDRTTFAATEGTAAHELGELALRANEDAASFIGSRIDVEGTEVEVTEEMAEAVQLYIDTVKAATFRPKPGNPHIAVVGQLFLERQFSLEALNPPAPMFGTSDAIIWHEGEGHLHVLDYKHGRGVVVDAIGNPQLAYYALGAVLALEVVPQTITMTIVQPRASHRDGPVRSWTITFEELKAFKHQLFAAAELTQQPNAPIVPGDHCRFCRASPVCPAQKDRATALAQSEFEAFAPPAPATLSLDELVTVLNAADAFNEWLRSVESHALTLLEQGQEVPGWKLVEKRATRKWADEAAICQFLDEHMVARSEAYIEKLKSPAQLEALLKKQKIKLPEDLVVKQSSGLKMARDTDPRPAQLPSAQTDFDIPVGADNPQE